MSLDISQQSFGNIDGQEIILYTLTNDAGMRVGILNYGGTIKEISVPDNKGRLQNIVLGFNTLEGYLQPTNPYMGSLIGRFSNRIAGARFQLDGQDYQHFANDQANSLHGGQKGFDKVIWNAISIPSEGRLELSYLSPDGEEGYPGNLLTRVAYTLTQQNELQIAYAANSDRPTPINLTSHAYFNLSGGEDATILDHRLLIRANRFAEVNDQLIPTGELPLVKDGPMDFTSEKTIGRDIVSVPGGYDHAWLIDKEDTSLALAATLTHPGSGRLMEVWTTEPSLQFYSGNFLDGTLKDTNGRIKDIKQGGLCLEAQHLPDSPNQPAFPNTILRPGDAYQQTTVYKFSLI